VTRRLLALGALGALAAGALLHVLGHPTAGGAVWAASTAVILVPLSISVAGSLFRRDVGVDAIALVAIASALAFGQYLAGAVIALMLARRQCPRGVCDATGRERVDTPARADAPRGASSPPTPRSRRCPSKRFAPATSVVIRAGEVVAVDGVVATAGAVLDAVGAHRRAVAREADGR